MDGGGRLAVGLEGWGRGLLCRIRHYAAAMLAICGCQMWLPLKAATMAAALSPSSFLNKLIEVNDLLTTT